MSICSRALDLCEASILPLVVVFCVLLLIMVPSACYCEHKKHSRLLQQCIDDGNKEYVCEGMLKRCGGGSGGTVHPLPLGNP